MSEDDERRAAAAPPARGPRPGADPADGPAAEESSVEESSVEHPGGSPAEDPTPEELAAAERAVRRRRPRYRVLIGLGVLVGAVVAAVLAAASQDNETYSRAAVFGYLLAGLGLVGGLLGGLVGVLLERVGRRR